MNSIYVHPTAEVSEKAIVGDGTKIWNHAQIRDGACIGRTALLVKMFILM